jgi:hypothetical protein
MTHPLDAEQNSVDEIVQEPVERLRRPTSHLDHRVNLKTKK